MSLDSIRISASPSVHNDRLSTAAGVSHTNEILAKNRLPCGRFDVDNLAQDIAKAANHDPALARSITHELGPALRPTEQGELERLVDQVIKAVEAAVEKVVDTIESIFGGLGGSEPEATKGTTTNAADIEGIATPADAPPTIIIAPEMQRVFDEQWSNSHLPDGSVLEQGGTLVRNKETGEISIVNIGGQGSTNGSFFPELTLDDPSKYDVLGVFHTHPYTEAEGGYENVSLSGGDAAYMINSGQSIVIAQSGEGQYAYVRTADTPANVDANALFDAQTDRMFELMDGGMDFAAASRQAALETAEAYGLAYYEGSNGTFTRVSP
jgi:hypothetical protein